MPAIDEYDKRLEALPHELRARRMEDATVRACLEYYLKGECTLEQALTAMVMHFAELRARALDAMKTGQTLEVK